jgi:endonuclease/exonuclease/phosphatase family metal-dependent hydrolase
MSVAQRRIQLAHVLESLPSCGAVVLTGDLNTLRKIDYSEMEWTHLCARARLNNWTPPEDGGLEILEEAGFRDCCANVASGLRTAPVGLRLYRIDYFLGGADFFRDWIVKRAYVAEEVDCSDHYPLVLDIERLCKL